MSDTSGTDQQEPSMEEILASIRRIIAEDGEEETDGEEGAGEAAPEQAAAEEPEPTPEPEPEAEPEPVEEPEPEPAAEAVEPEEPEEPEEDVLELTEIVEEEPAAAIDDDVEIELAEPSDEPDAPPDAPPDDGLMSDASAEETSSAFAALASAITASTPIGGAQRTIEDLLTDMLRPLLKVWLDDNLPNLVERMVRDEIERVAQRTRGR